MQQEKLVRPSWWVAVFLLCSFFLGITTVRTALSAELNYPSRPIRFVVTFPPGGGTDLLARKLAEQWNHSQPHSMFVENKPGASGNIGARYVAQAPADGYTLLMVNSSYAINPNFFQQLGFDPAKDLIPVHNLAWVPSVWVASKQSGLSSWSELLERMAQQQEPLLYGSCGQGTPQHLAAELLQQQSDLELRHVPYKGCGPALNDVLAGHLPNAFVTLSSASPYIERGALVGLAITAAERSQIQAQLPTLTELLGQPFDVSQWHAVFAPADTPTEIIEFLQTQIGAFIAHPDFQADLRALGYESATESPEQFRTIVQDDLQRYRMVSQQLAAEGN